MTGRRGVEGRGVRGNAFQHRMSTGLGNSPRMTPVASGSNGTPRAMKHPIQGTPGPSKPAIARSNSDGKVDGNADGKLVADIQESCQQLVVKYIQDGRHHKAIFWARELLAIREAQNSPTPLADKAAYLSTLCTCNDWARIVTYIECHQLYKQHLIFVYFYFSALFNLRRFSEVLSFRFGHMIEFTDVPSATSESELAAFRKYVEDQGFDDKAKLELMKKELNLIPSFLVILGKTYVVMQNRKAATSCFRQCLEQDAMDIEAIQEILNHKLLKQEEILKILNSETDRKSMSPARRQLFNMAKLLVDQEELTACAEVYKQNLIDKKHFTQKNGVELSEVHQAFYKSPATQAAIADDLFRLGDIHNAYMISSKLVQEDGYVGLGLLVYIGSLVQLKKNEELYMLSNRLVEMNPEDEVAWYAVGCYFHIVGDRADAKNYLNKCTCMNPSFGEAWIMFGHILTAESEHEHALSCYQRAARLIDYKFEPLLYIGLEHSYANNLKIARGHLKEAYKISGNHPIILHEEAILLCNTGDLEGAYDLMIRALRRITSDENGDIFALLSHYLDDFWEALVHNLGHVCRRRELYTEAIACHNKSLFMFPRNAEALSALSLCYASMYELSTAIKLAQQALTKNPTDDIMKQCLEHYMADSSYIDRLLTEPPEYSNEMDYDTIDSILKELNSGFHNIKLRKNVSAADFSKELQDGAAAKDRLSKKKSRTRAAAAANEGDDPEEMES